MTRHQLLYTGCVLYRKQRIRRRKSLRSFSCRNHIIGLESHPAGSIAKLVKNLLKSFSTMSAKQPPAASRRAERNTLYLTNLIFFSRVPTQGRTLQSFKGPFKYPPKNFLLLKLKYIFNTNFYLLYLFFILFI